MEDMNFKKQTLKYESKPIEGKSEFVIKGEYLIPDTHPDVNDILTIDIKTNTNNTEAFSDKIFVEGETVYNIIYTSKDGEGLNTYNVSYSDKFSVYIESFGVKKDSVYDIYVDIANINVNLLNERKVSVQGLLNINAVANDISEIEIITDLEEHDDIQLLMKESDVCIVEDMYTENLSGETKINVPLDKVAISKILICDPNIYKSEVKLLDGKIVYNAYVKIKILYKGIDSKDLYSLEQDVYLTKDSESEYINSEMRPIYNFTLENFEYMIDEDDLGESRIINANIELKCNLKVLNKETISVIDDAYSKNHYINLVKNNYKMNCIGISDNVDIIAKENIETNNVPVNVIYTSGRCVITDKKVVEGKIIIEGVVKGDIIYSTNVEDEILRISHKLPFSTTLEDDSIKIDMDVFSKCNLESIEASVEAKTISVKAVVNIKFYASSEVKKELLVDMYISQEDVPNKDCSIIIYIAGDDDTIWSIAKKYYVTIEDMCRINDISETDDITGQKLLIPCKAVF